MPALDDTPRSGHPTERRAQLAEALMSAAAELTTVTGATAPQPEGVPVRSGRLNMGRARRWLPADQPVMVVVGFAAACWLGAGTEPCPDLGRLTFRDETTLDARGRVTLGRQVRAWLAVSDPRAFEVVTMPVASGGLLVIPVEDFARRYEAVAA